MCSTLFLRAHEHIYFTECALSQNVLLPLLMVHFVSRMYYYYYYYSFFLVHEYLQYRSGGITVYECVSIAVIFFPRVSMNFEGSKIFHR